MKITETIIGIKEINDYLVPFLSGSKSIPEDSKLEFQFDSNLQSIDELFYAYLLLLKQSFPKIQIVLDIQSNKPKQIAKQHIVFLNAYYPQPFISINKESHLNIRNTKSSDFIPHILVQKNKKGELVGFEKSEQDELSDLLASDIFKNKTDIYSIIENANNEYDKQKTKKDTKETILAEKLKIAIGIISITPLRYFYKIDILSHLGVLEDYLTENNNEILILLKQNNFFIFSQIELYFFYLLVIQNPKKNLKEEYKNILSYFFDKTNKIYFGLKELAKNIIEHTESSLGVISARVHSKEKIDNFKNFGGCFDSWFDQYRNDNNTFCFLDINVIDAGKIGVTQKYIDIINEQINNDKTHVKVKEHLKSDKTTIEADKYGFSHFLNYQKIELLHQINRISSRIGLLLFSKTVCKDERGIVKASSINVKENNTESVYLYEDCDSVLTEEKSKNDRSNFVQFGTNYNFILPIQKKTNIPQIPAQPQNEQGVASSVLIELFNYKIIDITNTVNTKIGLEKYEKIFSCAEQIKKTIKYFSEKQIAVIHVEQLKFEDFNSSDWIRLLANISFDNKIPVVFINITRTFYQEIIDFNKVFHTCYWQNLSPILFYIKQDFPDALQPKEEKLSLWFSNVLAGNTYEDYNALNKQISYYQHNFYSIQNDKDEVGDKIVDIPQTPLFVDENLLNFELLIKKDDLTLFEHSAKSLMNLEIRTLPDKNLINNPNVTKEERFFYKFKGYKISDSHFRLGSKLHISDYYYAKRLFYNSFYANRFAFLITKYLLNTEQDGFGKWQKEVIEDGKKKMIDITDATLIGYSRYSELLVSNVKRLLELWADNNKKKISINHDVMLETESTLKNPEEIKDNVIIIVPIATTFSTSIKIKKNLKDILKDKIGNPEPTIINNRVINILFVSDKSFKNDYDEAIDKEWKKNFSWEVNDNNEKINCRDTKIIPIKENNKIIYKQKYFIQLESNWNLIHKCKLCFSDNIKEEVCLLETGKDGVSPETIFGFPVTTLDNICDNKITAKQYFNEEEKEFFLIKQHITRDNKHYKHYIKSEIFLEKSYNKVKEWLETQFFEVLKDKSKNSQIIIITPSRLANSIFVNMVNQYVFSDKATILQYSDTDDILQNFIRFNSSFFKDSTILFVDDVIHTATIFHKINNYIKSIPQSNSKCIDYCISLFNRLGYFDREEVQRNLSEQKKENIISFVDINLPSVKLSNYEFPEVIKQNLFNDLSKQSVTDIMKFFFKEELSDKKALDFDKEQYMPKGNSNQLFYFLVYKSLYSFFCGEYDTNSTEFNYNKHTEIEQFQRDKDKLLEILKQYVGENKNVKEFTEHYKKTGEKVYKDGKKWVREIDYTEELETQIISICAVPPFSLYKDIQEFAFYWVLEKLQKVVEEINTAKTNNNIKFFTDIHDCKNKPHCDYENFRRWLHLAADLKINYVFSVEMLKAINILFDNWNTNGIYRKHSIKKADENQPTGLFGQPKYIPESNKGKKYFDIGFLTYYVGIIEQLTKNDEAKAIKVIQNVATLIKKHDMKTNNTDLTSNDTFLTLRNNFNNKFIDCLRYLVFENTFIFNTFIDQFYNEERKKLANFSFENDTYDGFEKEIKDYYKERQRQQARWQSLYLMLSEYDNEIKPTTDVELENAFYKTVYLKILLENDKNEKIAENKNIQNANIQKKTEIILQYLSDILGINKNECENGGSYFTVRYKDLDKPEKDIEEDDLYTISQYTNNQMEDKLEMPLTDKDSIVFDLYQGIKEKNNRKPSSLIELFYHKGKNKYISSKIERYYSFKKEININKDKIETSGTFDHRYKKLLFLRIADIKEDKKYRKSIEKYIDEILEKKKLPKEFEHYKKFIIEPDKSILILERLRQKYSNNEKIVEKVNNYIKAIQENDLINFQYFSEEADFPLSIREKFMRKLKNAIEEAKNDNAKFINNVKEVLVEYKRKEVYRSFPVAVLGFYKCRLNENECPRCPKYKQDKCDEKRFDPKRIRFLLLLRDDIQKFVEQHLKNDSFSAYVENIRRKEPIISLSHGVKTYKDAIEYYNNTLKEYKSLLREEKEIDDIYSTSGKIRLNQNTYLTDVERNNIFKVYLINKWELINNFTKLKDNDTEEYRKEITDTFKVNDFIEEIQKKYLHIIHFHNPKRTKDKFLSDKWIECYVSEKTNINISFDFPNSLIEEITFEIIYNIRKYVIESGWHISETSKLQITLGVEEKNNYVYFVITNNTNKPLSEKEENRLNINLRNKENSNGLNLFYNYLQLYLDIDKKEDNIHIKADKGNNLFQIFIPIKKIENYV